MDFLIGKAWVHTKAADADLAEAEHSYKIRKE